MIDRQLELLAHPFYQAWMRGELTRTTLKDYALQYFTHVEAFPRYIGAIHSQCANPKARRVLLENLLDEEGFNFAKSHADLWADFARGMGCADQDFTTLSPRPAITKVKQLFFELARSSYAEGLGALYAYEAQVPEVAASKIEGLKKFYNVEDEPTLAFFKLHKDADVVHRQALKELLSQLSEDEHAKAQAAAQTIAQALWDFLSDVYDRQTRAVS